MFKVFGPGETGFNPLPNDNILDWSSLKAFADDKLKMVQMLEFFLDRVENFAGKGENAGYHKSAISVGAPYLSW